MAVQIKAKQDAKKHYHEAKLWCIKFFLLNHKQAIQSIKYENKTYIGRAGVKEPNGKIKWYKLNLDDDWFEFQAVPGLKQRIMQASRSNEYVLMEQFQTTKKDQVIQMKYKLKQRGDTT